MVYINKIHNHFFLCNKIAFLSSQIYTLLFRCNTIKIHDAALETFVKRTEYMNRETQKFIKTRAFSAGYKLLKNALVFRLGLDQNLDLGR